MAQDPRHPKSTYEAKYPYNRVMVTESGHELHFDDTKGKERIRIAHKSGSYQEWSPNGKKVEMVTGHSVTYVKGGHTMTADKNVDTKVGGSTRSSVSGDDHSEVKGTRSSATSGDVRSTVGGDSVSATKGDSVHGVVGKHTMKVGGKMQVKADGGHELKVTGAHSIESSEAVTIKVGGVTMKISSAGVDITGGYVKHDDHKIDKTHKHTEVVHGGDLSGPPE